MILERFLNNEGKLRKFDIVAGILFEIATIILIYLFFNNEIFFTWAFQRHYNILSWYIRPLFIIPIIWSAYKSYFQELLSLFFVYLRVCSGFQSQIQLILKLRNF